MKIDWVGTFDPAFERNLRLREYLEESGVDYQVKRLRLWPSDRLAAFDTGRLRVFLRMVLVYPTLFVWLLVSRAPDLYLVSYPGWFDIPVVKAVATMKRRPVVFDVFISLYDTAILDRGLAASNSVAGRFVRFVDRLSMRLASRVIVDCSSHRRFLAEMADLPVERFGLLFIGADEAVFHPSDDIVPDENTVLFYGTFVPLQGVEWIIRAAALLDDSPYRFRIVGRGQQRASAVSLAERLDAHVDFVEPMTKVELAQEVARAALCLGIFGTSGKANRVIPHKVYEALACARPVVTGATDAVSELFATDELAVVPVGDPDALARTIDRLMQDPMERDRLSRKGYSRFTSDFALGAQAQRLRTELELAFSAR